MPDSGGNNNQRRAKYPNSFLFGIFSGVMLSMASRRAAYEPMHARPFGYIQVGLVLGVSCYYYDYWRRRAIEEVLYNEEKMRYH